MKYAHLLFAALLLSVSCKKEPEKVPDTSTGTGDFAYEVDVASIVRSPANAEYSFVFNIKLLSGSIVGNNVTCFVEDLPPQVGVSPGSVSVGHLLGGVFTFDVGNLTIGDYPFRLKTYTDKYGEGYTDVTLRITPIPDIVPHLTGTYDSCYDYCPDSGFVYYSSVLSAVPDSPYVLNISNIRNAGSDVIVRAVVDDKVSIPVQSFGAKTIWGSGTYGIDSRPSHGGDYILTLNDTIVSGTDTLTCTMHIEH